MLNIGSWYVYWHKELEQCEESSKINLQYSSQGVNQNNSCIWKIWLVILLPLELDCVITNIYAITTVACVSGYTRKFLPTFFLN
jgi:hypothetical protein